MRKTVIVLILVTVALVGVVYAATRYEPEQKETRSIVAYGKNSGTIVAIAVDSNGVIQTY